MGSLLVGVSFAKGFARSLNIPMIDVNHLTGHVLAHFIKAEGEEERQPVYPFLCLLVSGGNSQIILCERILVTHISQKAFFKQALVTV